MGKAGARLRRVLYFRLERRGSQGFTLGYYLSLPTGGWLERGFAAYLVSQKLRGRVAAWLKPSPDTGRARLRRER
jgi:hypothetical protein